MRLRQLCALDTVISMPPPSIRTKQKSEMAGRNRECHARRSLSVTCRSLYYLMHSTNSLLSRPLDYQQAMEYPPSSRKCGRGCQQDPQGSPDGLSRSVLGASILNIYSHILLTNPDPLARGIHSPELFPASPGPGYKTLPAGRCSHLRNMESHGGPRPKGQGSQHRCEQLHH